MREHSTRYVLFLAVILLTGCSRESDVSPSDLIEVVKERSFALPKDVILISDGSEPRYVMVVRQVKDTSENRESTFPTNAVQGEWFFANKYKNPDTIIATVREFGTEGLFTVHFLVAQATETDAVVDVFVSYGERGGDTRKWTFLRRDGRWELTKDDRTGFWD